MLKFVLRNTLLYAAGLYVLPFILSGVQVRGGFTTYITAGLILLLLNKIIAPVLNLITLPLRLVSFGIFTFVTNSFILYILTVLIPQIHIVAFRFPGFVLNGFVFPPMDFNTFFAYIAASVVLTLFVDFIKWLHEVHL